MARCSPGCYSDRYTETGYAPMRVPLAHPVKTETLDGERHNGLEALVTSLALLIAIYLIGRL